MSSPTPILDRIRQREAEAIGKVIEFRQKPRWLQRLKAVDHTNLIYVNGAWTRPNDGGAA